MCWGASGRVDDQMRNQFMYNFEHINRQLIFINLVTQWSYLPESGLEGSLTLENIINLQYPFCDLKILSKLQFFFRTGTYNFTISHIGFTRVEYNSLVSWTGTKCLTLESIPRRFEVSLWTTSMCFFYFNWKVKKHQELYSVRQNSVMCDNDE